MKRLVLISTLLISLSTHATIFTIDVSDFQYSPASIPNVACSDTIVWVWLNGSHTTTSGVIPAGATSWNSDINSTTTSFSYVPTVAGTYDFHCVPHGFTGTFTVTCASSGITFQEIIGTPDSLSDALATCVQQTSDGGYVTTGYISNFGSGDDDIYLVKTDGNGAIQWTKTYGDTSGDDANYVIQTMDGGYAITGVTTSFGGENIFLIKTDSIGNVMWSSVYGTGDSASDASASSMQQTMDNGYVITGYSGNYGAGSDDYYLLKTDASGLLLWTKTYGGVNDDDANSVIQTADSGYIMAGTSSSFSDTLGDVYIVKTNSTGDTLWTRSFGTDAFHSTDIANSIQQTSDMGYIIAGVVMTDSAGEFGELIKTDSAGNFVWARLFGDSTGGSDVSLSSVQQLTDSNYVVTGYTSNFGLGDDDVILFKITSTGNWIWQRTYGSSGTDDGNFLRQTTDGGYIIGGVTTGFSTGGEHIYLVKTDDQGHSICNETTPAHVFATFTINMYSDSTEVGTGGIATITPMNTDSGGVVLDACLINSANQLVQVNQELVVYPNPFSNETRVRITSNLRASDQTTIRITDLAGHILKNLIVPYSNEITINCSDLASGIYFLQVNDGNNSMSKKLIIEK